MLSYWLPLIIISALISVFALKKGRLQETRELFLVANRKVGLVLGIMAITATWTQAPALLASGLYAYKSSLQFALFWVPNVFALIIPIYVVTSMRKVLPQGYTGSQYLGAVYGPYMRTMGFGVQLCSLIGAVASTLLGIAQWLSPVIGVSQWLLTGVFGVFAFVWVLFSGLPGALVADRVKVISVFVLAAGAACLWWLARGDIASVSLAMPASESALHTIWQTGVLLAISLIGGALVNPDIGERSFALVADTRVRRRVYLSSALLFGVIALAFGSLGILAAGVINGPITGFPAFAVLNRYASHNGIILGSVCLSLILIAALAAYIASAGDLLGIEAFQRFYRWKFGTDPSSTQTVWVARLLMPFVILLAVMLALQPDLSIPKIVESLAVLRGGIIFPMLIAPLLLYRGVTTQRYDIGLSISLSAGLIAGLVLTYAGDLGLTNSFIIANGKPLGAVLALMMPLVALIIALFGSLKRGSLLQKAAV